MSKVLIIAEHLDGKLNSATAKCVSAAQALKPDNIDIVVLAADREFKILARNALDEPCHATPAIANGKLYVRTESSLICIGNP